MTGRVERDVVLDGVPVDVLIATTRSPSLLRCASFCLNLDKPNWVCNMKVDPNANHVTCEVIALNGSTIFDTDLASYPGSAVVYDSTMRRVGENMFNNVFELMDRWMNG